MHGDRMDADLAAAFKSLEARLARIEQKVALVASREQSIAIQGDIMATNQEILQAAFDKLNITTSQEAALLAADNAKLDAIQALITTLVNTAGVPQSILDQATAIQSALDGVTASTEAQAARLDALATDPRNPVPVPPPAIS